MGIHAAVADWLKQLSIRLSESYQFLITALESRADSLSWELVTSRLLHEDMKRKEQGGGGVDGAAHGQGQAFMVNNNKRKGRPVKKTGACHNCGKQGHWIAECPSRVHNDAERYRSQRANVAQDEEDPGDCLFSVGRTSSTAKPSDMWLVDSGATQHMTSSKTYMRNYKTMAPVDVHLADDGVVQAVAAKFAEFVAFAETQTGKRVQTLRSDNGGEYTSGAMAKFCADHGIVQKFTPPYTPQLNGVAERMNRTLVECARCMLEHAGLPKTYWGEAVMTATFLRNRCPTRAISHDKSPHQVWTGKKPLLANLKVFGCHAYVHVPKAKRTKFDARSVRCRFLGYSEHEKAYRFEELESSRVLVSRDAQFMEDVFDSGRRDYHQREVVVDGRYGS
uniref:Integrase catalytic domain-containing protein n=1 Tax=Phytophthora ramorum TaxID=164328 RepID=H3H9T3_PHYRM